MITALLWTLGATLALVTLLPLRKTHAWWVRGCDFPRLHIWSVAALTLMATLILQPSAMIPLTLVLGAVLLFQGLQILPYTPLYPTEVTLEPARGHSTIKALASNVLMENTDPTALQNLIKSEDPDILFLMETDQAWIDRMAPTLSGFATVKTEPRDDHYGMVFATNLKAEAINFVDLANGDTPTVFATLTGPNGTPFNYIGLHPRPPLPGDDTDARDAQIRKSATIASHLNHPILCMGDFNDVAWSRTSRRFKDYGGYRDPRVGRGMFPSFDVTHRIMRFPIDQVYLTEGIHLVEFKRGPNMGSDHFPMIVTLFLDA